MKIAALADERPIQEVRAEHAERIERALGSLREPHGMAQMLRAAWIKGGSGSLGNLALMADQAPGQLVENHYGWSNAHGLGKLPKGCRADVFLSNGRMLPVPCWSVRNLAAAGFIPSDYAEQRFGEVPEIDRDYAERMAESWRGADDPDRTPVARLRLLNAWGREVEPRPVVAENGEGLGEVKRDEVPIPF